MLKSCFRTRAEKAIAFDSADIYPVISSEFCLGRPVLDIFRAVAEGGAKLVQLREKHQGKRVLFDLAVACRPIANEYGILLIINDHVDVALAANADGASISGRRICRSRPPGVFRIRSGSAIRPTTSKRRCGRRRRGPTASTSGRCSRRRPRRSAVLRSGWRR